MHGRVPVPDRRSGSAPPESPAAHVVKPCLDSIRSSRTGSSATCLLFGHVPLVIIGPPISRAHLFLSMCGTTDRAARAVGTAFATQVQARQRGASCLSGRCAGTRFPRPVVAFRAHVGPGYWPLCGSSRFGRCSRCARTLPVEVQQVPACRVALGALGSHRVPVGRLAISRGTGSWPGVVRSPEVLLAGEGRSASL